MDLTRLSDESASIEDDESRRAAVLVPVIDRPSGPHLLFTRRADWLSRHPGQMSFPGGAREPGDEGPVDTAKREAEEEVGLAAQEAEIVGRLPSIVTVSGFVVTPIVARVPDREYVPDGEEIVEILILPVESFCDPANLEREWRNAPDGTRQAVEYFHIDGHTVWGATGRLVCHLLSETTDWELPDDEIEGT